MNNKNLKLKTSSLLISVTVLLAILFCLSYFITFKILNINNNSQNQSVYSNNNYLSDNIFVALKTNNLTDMIESLSNLKLKLNLNKNLTEDDLIKELSKKGYTLSEKTNEKLTFSRSDEVIENKFESNKYYIGEENGYLCIFKTDTNGNIITDEKKIYDNSKPISMLPELDQEYIKSYKLCFETKEEALEKLSELIS